MQLEDKIEKDFELDHNFRRMDYFAFTELLDKSQTISNQNINREKMAGRYLLKIKDELPSPLKIAQFANEPIAFHLHKRGDFFKKLDGFHSHEYIEKSKLQQ